MSLEELYALKKVFPFTKIYPITQSGTMVYYNFSNITEFFSYDEVHNYYCIDKIRYSFSRLFITQIYYKLIS